MLELRLEQIFGLIPGGSALRAEDLNVALPQTSTLLPDFQETFNRSRGRGMLKACAVYKRGRLRRMMMPRHVPRFEGDANELRFRIAPDTSNAHLTSVKSDVPGARARVPRCRVPLAVGATCPGASVPVLTVDA